jgi:hypothetical protein
MKGLCFVWMGMFWLSSFGIFAQQNSIREKEIDLDAFLQQLFIQLDEPINYQDFYESLYQRYSQPLDLNKASKAELYNLYLLSQAQADSLLSYRQQAGNLLSIYELQSVPGWDQTLIDKVLPFVTVTGSANTMPFQERIRHASQHYLMLRYERTLEKSRGYQTSDPTLSRFIGSPDQFYLRYRLSQPQDFSFGLTLEKDPGEKMGPDFYSFHAQLSRRGHWKDLMLGDYQLQVGQGLVLSGGFTIGKGAESILSVRRQHLGIRPYTSVMESGFFRGGAATWQQGSISLTGFYSLTRRDASANQDSTGGFISSLQQSGLHRTQSEMASRQRTREQNMGLYLLYQPSQSTLEAGLTVLHTRFELPLRRNARAYNQFEFQGQDNLVLGGHLSGTWQNLNFFGETARSSSGGWGWIAGMIANLSRRLEFSMLHRHYARNFHSFYGNAFGESSRNINESGWYWGLKYSIAKKWTWNAWYDLFRFPWLRYLVDAPSEGYGYMLRTSYQPSKQLLVYAQFREEANIRNLSGQQSQLEILVPTLRQQYLINLDFQPEKWLFLRSRFQWSSFRTTAGTTHGMVIAQDLQIENRYLQLSTRLALFDTEDYDNRQYLYEKDLRYAFSFPVLYDQGIRHYVLAQYKGRQNWQLGVRYARTRFSKQDSIGSGLDRIQGNTRTELKWQLIIQF